MCGVFGIFSRSKINHDFTDSIFLELKKRGPDAQGTFFDDFSYIKHFRLRIQDPVASSDQPFLSEDSRFILSFNGQIYNHREVRRLLELEQGVQFKTSSDAECLLKAYIYRGIEGVDLCEGDFAGLIYDTVQNEVTLFRDLLGVKPLYIYQSDQELIVSSLLDPIKKLKRSLTLHQESIVEHAALRYSLGEKTIYQEVRRLLPGHIIQYNLKTSSKNLFHLNTPKSAPDNLSDQIRESVAQKTPDDQHFSVFLSGGVDSLGVAECSLRQKINWTAVSLEAASYGHDAMRAQEWTKKNNVSFERVQLRPKNLYEDLSRLMKIIEEPIGDSVCLLSEAIFKQAQSRGKVALSGEGADELFGGYSHHKALFMWSRYGRYLSPIIRYLPDFLITSLNPYPESLDSLSLVRLKAVLAKNSFSELTFFLNSLLSEQEISALFGASALENLKKNFSPLSNYNDFWEFEKQNWLPNYSLLRNDKVGMSMGLEVRVPYLDRKIYKFAQMNQSKNISFWSDKKTLRIALAQIMNPEMASRKKEPFSLISKNPITQELVKLAQSTLSESSTLSRSIWDGDVLKKIIKTKDDIFTAKKMVNLLMLEIWMRNHTDLH